MNIRTRTQGFEITTAIDRFVHDQLRSALQIFAADVTAVDVFIKDMNGPKGGIDKQVLIRVRLRNRQLVTIQTEHENLYAAVRKGTRRAKRAVRRLLKKSQRIRKQRMRDCIDHASASVAN